MPSVDWQRFQSLLDLPSPAVLTTYRRDGSASVSPVWFQFDNDRFQVVIAEGDAKLRHLERRPECTLIIFEAKPPFRGIRVDSAPILRDDEGAVVRSAIAARYLGSERGSEFVKQRKTPGVVLELAAVSAQTWDLSGILPAP